MPEDEELKRCPDCAEMVRAQARKCRFCGYRFDRRARAGNGPHQPPPGTIAELLEDWEIALDGEENVELFTYARARGARGGHAFTADGFLLVTSARMLLISTPRRLLPLRGQARPVVMFERRLSDLGEPEIAARLRRATLRVGHELTLSAIPRSTLERLRTHIAANRRPAL
jgi:hypothetical protein